MKKKIKKKMIVLNMCLGLMITGCQRGEIVVHKVDEVPSMASEELVIPDQDNITMKEEKVWIVDQCTEEWSYDPANEERDLVITNEQGKIHEITKDYLSWEVINQDGKDYIYYVDSKGVIYYYDLQSGETIEIGGKRSRINYADIQKDNKTDIYYVILKENVENSYYYSKISVLDLYSGEILLSDLPVIYGYQIIYDGKLYYTKEVYSPQFEEYGSILPGEVVKSVSQINTYDLKNKQDTVFFNVEDFYKERNVLKQLSQELGKYASCGIMYHEDDHLLLYVNSQSESGDWPQWGYHINLVTGKIQPLGTEDSPHALVGGSSEAIFIRNEKIYAISQYSDGSKALNTFDIKTGKTCLSESEFIMQAPIGLDDMYIYMYDNKEDNYFTNEIMSNLSSNTDKLYKINIDTLKKEPASIDEIPLITFERDDYYTFKGFEIRDGVFIQNVSNEAVGLFKKGETSPFFTSHLYIVSFEEATILSEHKLNLISDTDALKLMVGENQQINCQVDQNEAKIYFSSTNPKVARVDKAGLVVARRAGNTEIIITAIKDGYKRDLKHISVEVTEREKVEK